MVMLVFPQVTRSKTVLRHEQRTNASNFSSASSTSHHGIAVLPGLALANAWRELREISFVKCGFLAIFFGDEKLSLNFLAMLLKHICQLIIAIPALYVSAFFISASINIGFRVSFIRSIR